PRWCSSAFGSSCNYLVVYSAPATKSHSRALPGGRTSAASPRAFSPCRFSCQAGNAARRSRTTIGCYPRSARPTLGNGQRSAGAEAMNGSIGDIFWIFLMFTLVQPWLRQKMLDAARIRLIHRIEGQRKCRLILLVHREETMSLLGFPIFRYIDINDAEEVIRAIRLTDPSVPIDLVLHSPGGLALASLQIARAIQAHEA